MVQSLGWFGFRVGLDKQKFWFILKIQLFQARRLDPPLTQFEFCFVTSTELDFSSV